MIPTMSQTLNFLGLRKQSYQSVFGPTGAAGNEAMKDLAKFCHAFESTVIPNFARNEVDREMSLVAAGKREVWLRIQQHLHLQPEELAALYKAVSAGE